MQDGNFTEHEPQSNKFHRISLPSFLLLLKPIQLISIKMANNQIV